MTIIPHFLAVSTGLSTILKPGSTDPALGNLANLYISLWDFDEKWYVSNNPDLASAIPSENFPTGWRHFCVVGYFEGRLPVAPHVDATWYMSTYPDVASAIIEGAFADASEHFLTSGYREGRLSSDPRVEPAWYAPRYMPQNSAADANACTNHFLRYGYLNGAIPARPR